MDGISAPLPLIQKKYSLEPDMIFGWKPKVPKSTPIPLDFGLNPLPVSKDQNDQKFPVIYIGYRPQNSHSMHKYFSDASTYNYLFKSPAAIDIKYNHKSITKFYGMKAEFKKEIEFDSAFECGNLDKAVKISKNEYDLYMRSDTNTYGNYKWFYFKVLNKSEDRCVKLNIVNFKERHSLFNQGQKPMIKVNNEPWEPIKSEVCYKPSKLNKIVKKGLYHQLSFEVYLKMNEVCYISTTLPYSFSDLHNFFDENAALSIGSLGKSLSGINIPLITMTSDKPHTGKKKKFIIVQARQHPSETVSSLVMQNFIQFLQSGSKESCKLLEKYIFKIIPMVNIDGVTIGNSRMSFSGDDLNRKFGEPDKSLHPEVLAIKRLVEDCKNESGVFLFIDIHGHSKKKGSFMYAPYFPLHHKTYSDIRLLPKLLAEKSEIFRFYSCRFKSEKSLRQSARLVMSQNLGIKYTYTMENSLFGYIDQNRQSHAFKNSDFSELAQALIKSVFEFSKALQPSKKGRFLSPKASLNAIVEDPHSSSDSDSQSESEEECIEAKKKVLRAINRYKKTLVGKAISPHSKPEKFKATKRIKSQNQFATMAKNLPDLGKKQMLTSKPLKSKGRIGYTSSNSVASRIHSLNDTFSKIEPTENDETCKISPDQSILHRQKTKCSRINLFEMFTNRKPGSSLEHSPYKYRRNFNFPAFFVKPMRNN